MAWAELERLWAACAEAWQSLPFYMAFRTMGGSSGINTETGPIYPWGTPELPSLHLGHASARRHWVLPRPFVLPGEGAPVKVKPRLSDMNCGFKIEMFP